MPEPQRAHLAASSLDDLLNKVLERIASEGTRITSTGGANTEIWGASLVLTNPLARVSRSETRGKVFSPLGELCWYLSGSADHSAIEYYIAPYPNRLPDGRVFGAYGPRLREKAGGDQIQQIITMLRRKPDSRRAVMQIFDSTDNLHPDQSLQPPCTCTLQFLVRDGALQLLAYMRSNDVMRGMTHDVFCFTMLQELVARSLDRPLGTYTHMVGSLHVYDRDAGEAQAFLDEDWQQTAPIMPAMPPGDDPWAGVDALLEQEALLRRDGADAVVELPAEEYWADLVRLLQIYALTRGHRLPDHASRAEATRDALACQGYAPFVTQRLDGRA